MKIDEYTHLRMKPPFIYLFYFKKYIILLLIMV
jgi:hypothetical protein